MKILRDPIGNRNHDLPACSAVPNTVAVPPIRMRQNNWLCIISVTEKTVRQIRTNEVATRILHV